MSLEPLLPLPWMQGSFPPMNAERSHAGGEQNLRHHRGRGSLAMGAGNTNGVVVPAGHDAQQLAALQNRNAACLGGDEFRIVRHDGCGVHDQVSALDVFRTLSQLYRNTHVSNRLKRLGFVVVRAGEVKSTCVEDLCQRIHAAAANPDEMNMLFTV